MFQYKLFYHNEIFHKKRFLVDVKAKYFLLETKMQGVETELQEARRRFPGAMEVILQIWRLRGHFYGAHGASAPPPLLGRVF